MTDVTVTQEAREAVAEYLRNRAREAFQGRITLAHADLLLDAFARFERDILARHRTQAAGMPATNQADIVDRVARILAPRLEGGRAFDQMPADSRVLKVWARNAMCWPNDATQEDAIEAAQAVIAEARDKALDDAANELERLDGHGEWHEAAQAIRAIKSL